MTNDKRDLPPGWAWTRLEECADVITGTTPSKKEPKNYGNHLPFVKPPELRNHSIAEAEDNLSAEGAKLARVLPPNSVLVSCIGNLGKTGINRIPVAFNQQINAVTFRDGIIPEYGFYYFQSSEFRDWLESVSSATTVAIVNKGKFQQGSFPLAPLPEQRRIVAKIESLFTRLDAGVAALKRAQANLKRYKAAVLKAACEGRLVPQDPGDEPAEKLLARILAERERGGDLHGRPKARAGTSPAPAPTPEGLPELPKGWCRATFDMVGEVQGGIQKQPKRAPKNNAYPYLRVANVMRGCLNLSEVYQIELFGDELDKLRLESGDLLIVEGNGSQNEIGRSALWKGEIADCVHQNHIIRVRFLEILSAYVSHYLNSPSGIAHMMSVAASTSGLYTLSTSKVKAIVFPLPPLVEQRRIVAEVERRLSVVAEMETTVAHNLARAGRLRQAILKRAFAGKLVAQDPNDEPAERLLERIRVKRVGATLVVALDRAAPNRADAGPNRAGPDRAGPDRAGPDRAGTRPAPTGDGRRKRRPN